MCFSLSSFSQHGLQINTYFPTSETAYAAHTSFGINYTYQYLDKYSKFRAFAKIGYIHYNITDEPMHYLTIRTDLTSITALPSEYHIEKFNSIPIGIIFEYKFLNTVKLSPVAGIELLAGVNSIKYTDNIATVSERSFEGYSFDYGFSLYVGSVYKLNKSFEITTKLGYKYAKDIELGKFTHVVLSIGLTYYNY